MQHGVQCDISARSGVGVVDLSTMLLHFSSSCSRHPDQPFTLLALASCTACLIATSSRAWGTAAGFAETMRLRVESLRAVWGKRWPGETP